MPNPVDALRRLVRDGNSDAPGTVVDALGRVGLVGYGLVHLLVAWLAGGVAVGSSRGPADPRGAAETVAATPGGGVLLVLLTLGLLTFAVWQLVAAALGFRWVHGGERVRKRVGAVSKAIAMAGLAVAVVAYLAGSPDSGGDGSARSAAASLLAVPGGRLLLGAAALSADATRAGGLDAALRTLGTTAFGTTLPAVVAAGFTAFGLFCFADAATRRA